MARFPSLRRSLVKFVRRNTPEHTARVRRWRNLFPRWLFSGDLGQLMRRLFPAWKEPGKLNSVALAAAWRRGPRFEQLEGRQMLSATVWVNDNWHVVTDVGPVGLSTGDTVDNINETSPATITGKTFGTDAFATIQTGVNAASSGDTVLVVSGTYTEDVRVERSTGNLRDNLTVRASGSVTIVGGFFVQSWNYPSQGAMAQGPEYLTIDGFHITDGVNDGGHRVGVVVKALHTTIKNNTIENVTGSQANGIEVVAGSNNLMVDNNDIGSNYRGIYLNPADGVTLRHNYIHANNGSGVGIGSSGQSNFLLEYNTISDHHNSGNSGEGWGIDTVGANVVARYNTFSGNDIAIDYWGGNSITAENNWWGNATGAADATGTVEVAPGDSDPGTEALNAEPAGNLGNRVSDNGTLGSSHIDYYPWASAPFYRTTDKVVVDDDWAIKANGDLVVEDGYSYVIGTNAFATIQAGINAVDTGGTANVAAGTYNEAVSVNKTVTLRGAQAGIAGDDASRPVAGGESIVTGPSTNGNIFGIAANNAVVDGFLVENFGAGTSINGFYLSAATSGYQLLNNIIRNNTIGVSLASQGTTQTVIAHNLLETNNRAGAASGDAFYGDTAMKNILVDDNKLVGNNVAMSLLGGVYGYGPVSDLTVSNNILDGSGMGGGFGISGQAKSFGGTLDTNLRFTNNVMTNGGTGRAAFRMVGVDHATVDGNEISGFGDAIDVCYASTDVDIANNILTGNIIGLEAHNYAFREEINLQHNAIFGNSTANVKNGAYDEDAGYYPSYGAAAINASGNWWGSSDPATVALTMSGTVDFAAILASNSQTSHTGTPGFYPTALAITVHALGAHGSVGRIQDGVDSVASGGTITVLDGTYADDVNIDKGLTLTSANGSALTSLGPNTIYLDDVAGVDIGQSGHGFAFDGGGLWVGYPHQGWSDVNIEGNAFTASAGGYSLVMLGPGSNATVSANSFSTGPGNSAGNLAYVEGSNVDVTGNQFTGSAHFIGPDVASGALLEYVGTGGEITANVFAGISDVGNLLLSGTGNTVSGNTFGGSSFTAGAYQIHDTTGAYSIGSILSGNTFNRAVTVTHSSDLLSTIWANVQGGVDAASSGDIVNLAAGTYVENPALSSDTKQLNFLGATALDGTPLPTIQGTLYINLPGNDDNWQIKNINFLANTSDTAYSELLQLWNVNGLTIDNCTFDGAGKFADPGFRLGVTFPHGSSNGNQYVTIQNSTFKNGLYGAIQGYVNHLTVPGLHHREQPDRDQLAGRRRKPRRARLRHQCDRQIGLAEYVRRPLPQFGGPEHDNHGLHDQRRQERAGPEFRSLFRRRRPPLGRRGHVGSESLLAQWRCGEPVYVEPRRHRQLVGQRERARQRWQHVQRRFARYCSQRQRGFCSLAQTAASMVTPRRSASSPSGSLFAPVSNNDTPTEYYSSLQAAIAGTTAGGVVTPATGTFTENVTVDRAVTLGGTPTITGTLTLNNAGAQLSPGQSPGKMTVNGNVSLTSGSFDVDINGNVAGTGYDQLDVTGTVSLGATLSVSTKGYTPLAGEKYIIIANDSSDAVTGTFAGFVEGATISTDFGGSKLTARITYKGGDGNDVAIIVDGPASYTAPSGGSTALKVQIVGTNVQFLDGTTVVDSRPLDSFDATHGITIVGATNKTDTVTIDLTGMSANPFAITFDGGSGGETSAPDTLVLTGTGSFGTVSYTFDNKSDGHITLGSLTINYKGLEPITQSISASDVTLTYGTGNDTITISDSGTAGQTKVTSTGGETVTFVNPTNSLTINAGDGADTVNIGDFGSGFNAGLTINGDAGSDTVNVKTAVSLTGKSVSLTAETIDVDYAITTTTSGNITLDGTTSTGTLIDLDADISAAGTLTIQNAAKVDIGLDIDLRAASTVDLNNAVTLIDLSGTGTGADKNAISSDNGAVELAAISDSGTPTELEINAGTDISLASVDIANLLDVDLDTGTDDAATFAATGIITAGTVTVDGALNGTTPDDTITFGGNVTAAHSLKVQSAATVNLGQNVSLKTGTDSSADSELEIYSNITQIKLTGASGTTNKINGQGVASGSPWVNLASVSGSPSLEIRSDGDVTLHSVDVAGSLSVYVDQDSGDDAIFEATGSIKAGTVYVTGSGKNEYLYFDGTITSNTGGISVQSAKQMTFSGTMTAATSVEIKISDDVQIGQAISIIANNGGVNAYLTVGQITLLGYRPTTNYITSKGESDINLAKIRASERPSLVVSSEKSVHLYQSIAIPGSDELRVLDVTVDSDGDTSGASLKVDGGIQVSRIVFHSGDTGTPNDTLTVKQDQDLIAGTSVSISNFDTVTFEGGVDVEADDGPVSVYDRVGKIALTGVGATNMFSTYADSLIRLAPMTGTGNPDVLMLSCGSITLSSVNLGTGGLDATIDYDDDTAESLTIDGDVTAGTVGLHGATPTSSTRDDSVTINANMTASGPISVDHMLAVNVAGNVSVTTSDLLDLYDNITRIYTGVAGTTNTFSASDIVLDADVFGTGNLVLQPSAASESVGIAGGTGVFSLSTAELTHLQNGFNTITLGRANAGAVDIHTFTFQDPLAVLGGAMTVTGLAAAGSDPITLTSTSTIDEEVDDAATDITTGGVLTLNAQGRIGANDTLNGALDIDVGSLVAHVTVSAGAIYLQDTGGLTLTDVDTHSGNIVVHSTAGIVATDVLANSDVTLTADTGNIDVGDDHRQRRRHRYPHCHRRCDHRRQRSGHGQRHGRRVVCRRHNRNRPGHVGQ